jgi:hypothetical protein
MCQPDHLVVKMHHFDLGWLLDSSEFELADLSLERSSILFVAKKLMLPVIAQLKMLGYLHLLC